ncbi:MAG: hypothetical protein ACTSVL_02215 [Promethearchaeota archaeon]
MVTMVLSDLITLCTSHSLEDLQEIHYIPEQRKFSKITNIPDNIQKEFEKYRISQWWKAEFAT